MRKCYACGEDVSMPYQCRRCNENFCSEHRLPENHHCTHLQRGGRNSMEIINEIKSERSMNNKIKQNIPTNIQNKLSGKMWIVFLGIIGITYILQLITLTLFETNIHNSIFVLQADRLEYVWTIFTSIFAHNPNGLMHIIGNVIILFFFGRILEKLIGTKKFTILFLISGAIAGLAQIIFSFLLGNPSAGVLGASGSLSAVLGVLTVYNPRMKVYLYFILPISLWMITVGYIVFSLIAIASLGTIMGNVAHIAHLVGLCIGVLYGLKTKDQYNIPNRIQI